MKNVTNEAISKAGTAVTIALGLIGIMALWLGVMKVAEDAVEEDRVCPDPPRSAERDLFGSPHADRNDQTGEQAADGEPGDDPVPRFDEEIRHHHDQCGRENHQGRGNG